MSVGNYALNAVLAANALNKAENNSISAMSDAASNLNNNLTDIYNSAQEVAHAWAIKMQTDADNGDTDQVSVDQNKANIDAQFFQNLETTCNGSAQALTTEAQNEGQDQASIMQFVTYVEQIISTLNNLLAKGMG